MKKYFVLSSVIVMQICLGGLYAWSTFIQPLVQNYGLTISQTQIIFGLTIAMWTISMVFAGKVLRLYGPKVTATIGGIFFGLGYLVASVSRGSFWLILFGIAIIGGSGIGFGYICPLSTGVKWFPRRQGLVTGLAMAGFGGGAVILSTVANMVFANGVDVLVLFRWIGYIYGLIVTLAAQLFILPYKTFRQAKNSGDTQKIKMVVKTQELCELAGGFFCGTFAGILINGNLGPIGIASGLTSGGVVLGVSSFAVGNALGRLIWGYLHDRFGKITIPISLNLLAISVLSLCVAATTKLTFALSTALIGFGFGANFVLFAAQTTQIYGAENVGNVYPYIFLFYGLSGIVGPWFGGVLYEVMGNYFMAIIVAAVIALGGAFINIRPKIVW